MTKRRPCVIVFGPYNEDQIAVFRDHFSVVHAQTPDAFEAAIDAHSERVEGIATAGLNGLTAAQMARLPNLRMVALRGVGVEGVDLEEAKRRSIAVSNSPGVNAFSVAEHALALLLAIVRRIPMDNAVVHAGGWTKAKREPPRPLIFRKRVGILGLGAVGKAIAERLQGFEVSISYHNRNRRDDVPYAYRASVLELCENVDILIVAGPGGADTRGMVSRQAIAALGPNAHIVNVGRGSIIDQVALITALRNGELAGAALDVVDGEPETPAEMLNLPNVIITPHVAGRSPESRQAAIEAVCQALEAGLDGRPVANRIV